MGRSLGLSKFLSPSTCLFSILWDFLELVSISHVPTGKWRPCSSCSTRASTFVTERVSTVLVQIEEFWILKQEWLFASLFLVMQLLVILPSSWSATMAVSRGVLLENQGAECRPNPNRQLGTWGDNGRTPRHWPAPLAERHFFFFFLLFFLSGTDSHDPFTPILYFNVCLVQVFLPGFWLTAMR